VPAALGATTQAAVQVAQAAQAVSQHAASLHAAAEVHAAKADAATSQVQSLQATAQVRQATAGLGTMCYKAPPRVLAVAVIPVCLFYFLSFCSSFGITWCKHVVMFLVRVLTRCNA